MIRIFWWGTPNVFKVTIAVAEMGLESELVPVDIGKGDQFDPAFLALNPNHRVPAIIDTAPADGGAPLSVFESGAILLYLAEKTGLLLPSDPRGKANVMQWVMWQMAGQGPMLGQLGHFRLYAPQPVPYALERYSKEARRLYHVLDGHLADRTYIAGDYSIADIACWPWLVYRHLHGLSFDAYPHLARWHAQIAERPAVREAMKDVEVIDRLTVTEAMRQSMFNQPGMV